MSGRYSRTYSRKKSAPTISQFDALLTEPGDSTRLSATKTAGHLGKWGVTSFTSLRSINGGIGKEVSKRSYSSDGSPPTTPADPFSFESTPANGAGKSVVTTYKRRKFFKSRGPEMECVSPTEEHSSGSSISHSAEHKAVTVGTESVQGSGVESSVGKKSGSKTGCHTGAKKANKSERSAPTRSGSGIKLKIFKSRNVESSSQEMYSSTVELPSDDSRGASTSTSVASSPSTADPQEDDGEDSVPDSQSFKSELDKGGGKLVMNAPAPTSREVVQDSMGVLNSPGGSVNTSYECNFEFGKLVNQLPELADCKLGNTELVRKFDKSDGELDASNLNPPSTQECELGELDKVVNRNSETCSDSKCMSLEIKNEGVHSSFSGSEADCSGSYQESREHSHSESVNIKSKLCCDSERLGENRVKENIDLFGTDFDENEIVDRTTIDYSINTCPQAGHAMASQIYTQDMDDLGSSHGSPASQLYIRISQDDSRSDSHGEENVKSDLPPLTKKRSIFKSRTADQDTKKRATYKHKWHSHEDRDSVDLQRHASVATTASSGSAQVSEYDFDAPTTLKKVQSWPPAASDFEESSEAHAITRIRCVREVKEYFTVVKNVKRTHQLQESGEFQEFSDDVEFFLDALKVSNSISTRCLAALNLAQKCMVPAFRMHLRAHGTVIKFFKALADAPSDSRLSVCAAMVMFALSQDRLNMDLDRDSLELMLNLLDTDSGASTGECSTHFSDASTAELYKRIQELCSELQKKGHAKHLKLDKLNAGTLAMETLLSLTSKRAGEWFKEELRDLGGIDHLIRTVTQCTGHFHPAPWKWSGTLLEKLSKVDRCLKVLENVTHQNETNQEYLLNYEGGLFGQTLMSLYRLCHNQVPVYPECGSEGHNTATALSLITALITTLKVLINLTHNSHKEALGSKILGSNHEIYDMTLHCLLTMPLYLSHDRKFEVLILACCLLLNLVEHSKDNRMKLMKTKVLNMSDDLELLSDDGEQGAMKALVALFYRSEESAREQEAHTDKIIDHDLDKEAQEEEKKDEEIEETVTKLLQKAGRHMEDTLIAAYTALLTGYCIMGDEECEAEVRQMQPDGHFRTMVDVLKKFLRFMNLTATTSLLRSLKPTEKIVRYMERLDKNPEDEEEEEKKRVAKEAAEAMAYNAFGF